VSGLRGVTLAVRFLGELLLLAALGYQGFTVGHGVGAWCLAEARRSQNAAGDSRGLGCLAPRSSGRFCG
jgi:hypothetical protein